MSDKTTTIATINAYEAGIFGMRTMRRAFAHVTVVSLAVFAMSTSAFAQSDKTSRPNLQQTVEAFVTKFQDTYNKKDAAGLATLYTDDAVLVPPGPIAAGTQDIEKTWRAVLDAGRTGLKYKIQQIKSEGDLAWSVGQFTVMSPDEKGTPQERKGNFTHMYQWQGNELRLRVHAFTFLPSTPPR
jgi:uncharacterized protein (TIGR02246 family)